MIKLKSSADIEKLGEGGEILATILDTLEDRLKVGAVPKELDTAAREMIAKAGCVPSFLDFAPKDHEPFPAALCVSINDVVVHGMPGTDLLQDGDLVGIDLGLIYQGKYYLDSARTAVVGKATRKATKLLAVTNEALRLGIEAARIGNTIGDIGAAVQKHVEGAGYEVVRQLVGHGVGFGVHEEPQVPNYGKAGDGSVIEEGLVIAIEPMVTIGDATVKTGEDGWGVATATGNLAAHQEHTVAVTSDGPRILTKV